MKQGSGKYWQELTRRASKQREKGRTVVEDWAASACAWGPWPLGLKLQQTKFLHLSPFKQYNVLLLSVVCYQLAVSPHLKHTREKPAQKLIAGLLWSLQVVELQSVLPGY